YMLKQQARADAQDPVYQRVQGIEAKRKAEDERLLLEKLREMSAEKPQPAQHAAPSKPGEEGGETKPAPQTPVAEPVRPPPDVGAGAVASSIWNAWDGSIRRWIGGMNLRRVEKTQELLAGTSEAEGTDQAVADTQHFIADRTEEIAAQTPELRGQPGMQF